MCGGTERGHAGGAGRAGLSPRVRGNLEQIAQIGGQRGSIPACAGEPGGGVATAILPGVYPRVCGGTALIHAHLAEGQGLSPRVRGNP